MNISEGIDRAIGVVAPQWHARRAEARLRVAALDAGRAQLRGYDAAEASRANRGRVRRGGSADAVSDRAREPMSWVAHDLVRNNKYAAAAISQMVSMAWGDGIAAQAVHPVKRVQQRAQDALDRAAESRIDGFGDWFGFGKISVREMMVGGESLALWKSDGRLPNTGVVGMEGAQLDMSKTGQLRNGGKIVQGVEYDRDGMRVAYWLYEHHPQDITGGWEASKRVDAMHVDHLFERIRHGQTRGISWLAPVATTMRDIKDVEDARALREKIQNCLAIVLQSGPGDARSPMAIGEQDEAEGDKGRGPLEETIRPGMIARFQPGESATVVNPSPALGTVEFIRQQLAGVSANLAPYHLMTGDTTGANYTTLRAVMNGAYSRITDWQQNEIIPLLSRPMAERIMVRTAITQRDPRFLDVRFNWALPRRYMVDPIKDLAGEIMEIRAGLQTIRRSLGDRGLNVEEHFAELKAMNDLIDKLGLALDSDPRRVTDAGQLQQAVGWLAPKDGTVN
ncbi:phage portal protein [Stakelama tenebrarum]|uniref:Phage portal protein n=1 Tax=Stakelama tenebrarum TaxID=2711215 RepID=A0A6G6Y5W7_9SPHN|nr:phage portal protein [Sphingosinithalassobacter tenebrarum]QIG79983.1 phage portal protein [Sphingosinithalassobacter tenebrarum]